MLWFITWMTWLYASTELVYCAVYGNFYAWIFFSTVLAIAGEDFAVIASDTRLMTGFSILSRDVPKTTQL